MTGVQTCALPISYLGSRPFSEVYQLVGAIQQVHAMQQAQEQAVAPTPEPEVVPAAE